MNYEEVRSQINTGDVLGVRGHGAFPWLIRIFQRLGGLGGLSPITHIGLAWWVEGRLYSVEMDGRHNVLRPLSQHLAAGYDVDVYRCPVATAMPAQFDRATATPIEYSFVDIVKIGLRLSVGRKTGSEDDREMVCSTFAARWMQWAGWHPPRGFPDMPSPGELCRALGGQPAISIQGRVGG